MGVSTAIAVIALADSASANAATAAARKAVCTDLTITFDSHTANVAQAQEYASCVQYLYPQYHDVPLSHEVTLIIKAAIWACIIISTFTFFKSKSFCDDIADRLLLSVISMLTVSVIGMLLFLAFKVVEFLFS